MKKPVKAKGVVEVYSKSLDDVRNCSTCGWRFGSECHALPPVPKSLPDASGDYAWRAVWPIVKDTDGCGAWAAWA